LLAKRKVGILKELKQSEHLGKWRLALEFRNPTWYIGETFELLEEYAASMVLHDHPKANTLHLNLKTNFIYLRFHGPEGDYKGSYEESLLKEKSIQIKDWIKEGKDVFAYFNNTMGNALQNSITLKQLTKPK
jgi:uncharacterized protein YecE (DUF72 family)